MDVQDDQEGEEKTADFSKWPLLIMRAINTEFKILLLG
jgi:hypothetical protein